MSVIATFLPLIQAIAPPTAIATTTSARFSVEPPMNSSVTSVASTMPTPAQRTPLTAVTGELMRFKPTMKRNAAAR